MKFKRKILIILSVLISVYSLGQNNDSNDQFIPVLPYWKTNDPKKVNLKFFQEEIKDGKSIKSLIDFTATFELIEKKDSYYFLKWTFNGVNATNGTMTNEVLIISKLLNNNIIIKFSEFGELIEIINTNEIKLTANKIIDALVIEEKNLEKKNSLKITKQIISTKAGLESALFKSIKMYFQPFGHQYPLNKEMTYNLKYPNTLRANEPYNAIEKVSLKIVDNIKGICIIESNKTFDTKQLLKDTKMILKKKSNYKDSDLKTINKIGISENTKHQIDLKSGRILKLIFHRVTNTGILIQEFGYDIETID